MPTDIYGNTTTSTTGTTGTDSSNYWSTITNPATGKPYQSQQEYTDAMLSSQAQTAGQDVGVASANASAQGFNKDHTTDYNFGQSGLWSYGDAGSTNATGDIYFGSSSGGDAKTWVVKDPSTGQVRSATAAEVAQGKAIQVASNGGYIDPNTGKITYATSGSAYGPSGSNSPNGGGSDLPSTDQTSSYWYGQDYGLGPSALGIIPVQRDANGTPTKFYAGTAGGGGQVFSSLSDAQASVAAYQTWYDQQHPAGTTGTQIAPTVPSTTSTPATTTTTTPGSLTTPGAGENYYDATQGAYTDLTNAQTNLNATQGVYSGETNAQAVLNPKP